MWKHKGANPYDSGVGAGRRPRTSSPSSPFWESVSGSKVFSCNGPILELATVQCIVDEFKSLKMVQVRSRLSPGCHKLHCIQGIL